MEIIAIKQRLDAVEAALAKLLNQPAPEPSVKVVAEPVEAPAAEEPKGE